MASVELPPEPPADMKWAFPHEPRIQLVHWLEMVVALWFGVVDDSPKQPGNALLYIRCFHWLDRDGQANLRALLRTGSLLSLYRWLIHFIPLGIQDPWDDTPSSCLGAGHNPNQWDGWPDW